NPGYANGQTVKHGDSFITTTKGREPALYTLDHRTLIAARLAKVNVPVVFVSLTATVRGKELFKLTGKDGNEITLVNGSKEWSITDKYDKYANDLNQLHEKLHNALLKKLQSKELLPATAFTLAKEGDGKPVTEFSLNKIGSGMQKSSLMKAAEEYMNPDFMNDSVLEENFEKSQRHTNSLISTISKKLEIPEKKGRSKTSLLFESPEKTVIIKREDMPGTVSKVTAPNSFLGKPSDSLITKVEPNKVMPEKKLTPLSKLFLEIEKDKIKLQGKPVVKSMQPSKK
ncbi:MAG: hypothetical protein JWQ00_1696, partial [Noviherbaspirillum sp.]|nr:hypothetical protein [Noviherbaspirillum sp.]